MIAMNDEQLLASIPDFMVFETMLKARAATEGSDRIIYVEASSEDRDIDGEVVLSKALQASADYFLKFGVVDLDHKSMPAIALKLGLVAEEWAVGQPTEVRFDGSTTLVKAKLYSGDTPLAAKANVVWDGLTKLNPPARYYASVGGSVLGREVRVDPTNRERIPVVTKTRWNNLALSTTPANPHLATASTAPVGVFAKSMNGFVLHKGLEAGYGMDMAGLVGGSALRIQSLDAGKAIKSYWQFADEASALMSSGAFPMTKRALADYARDELSIPQQQADDWSERFFYDLHAGLTSKGKK